MITIGIMYDFDKTLCLKDMQEYSFIPSLGIEASCFWKECTDFAISNKMDKVLAYMYWMLQKSKEKNLSITRETFVNLGKDVEFFKGVETWFKRINDFGKALNVNIEHYIISSGTKEIIEGSKIKSNFKAIYAGEFLYDENGVAVWPKIAVNYTAKTQFLFRINKGVLDVSIDDELNNFIPGDRRRIPFRNMIYIGDGLTDVPCMKLVKANGGQSIAVYQGDKKHIVKKLIAENRVDFITQANYEENGEMEKIVKTIIKKIAATDELINLQLNQLGIEHDN